jgi:hypothetical protein
VNLQTIFKIYEINPDLIFKNVKNENCYDLYIKKFSELKNHHMVPHRDVDPLFICMKKYDEFYGEDLFKIIHLSKEDILCETYEIISEE